MGVLCNEAREGGSCSVMKRAKGLCVQYGSVVKRPIFDANHW